MPRRIRAGREHFLGEPCERAGKNRRASARSSTRNPPARPAKQNRDQRRRAQAGRVGHDKGRRYDPSTAADSFLVDRRGVLMKMKNPLPEYLHLPVVCGLQTENFDAGQTVNSPELKSALDLIRLTSESSLQSRFQVRSIDLSKGYCMVVTSQTRGPRHLQPRQN